MFLNYFTLHLLKVIVKSNEGDLEHFCVLHNLLKNPELYENILLDIPSDAVFASDISTFFKPAIF